MIISASRRTDLPALYPEWMMNRFREGEVLVPNPYNRKKVSRIHLTPSIVDAIVFWTKNPARLIPKLPELEQMGYRYGFQMTITDYERDMEPHVPDMAESIATFMLLSERIGKEKINWRFDPILLNDKYTISYHLEKFDMMCEWLHKATTRCIISFVDEYRGKETTQLDTDEIRQLAAGLSKIASKYKLPLYTCAEEIDLSAYGISHGACLDLDFLQAISGYKMDLKRDVGQRRECRCVESIDIGMYDTCTNGCKYCYATASGESAKKKNQLHDPRSPLLIGKLKGDETITPRKVRTARDNQISLFDLPGMGNGF